MTMEERLNQSVADVGKISTDNKKLVDLLLGIKQSQRSKNTINSELIAKQFDQFTTLMLKQMSKDWDEATVLQYADMFPYFQGGLRLNVSDYVGYGQDIYGETELYRTKYNLVCVDREPPDKKTEVYTKVGYNHNGTKVWVKPFDETDSYDVGDIVWYGNRNKEFICEEPGNMWAPDQIGWSPYRRK